MALYKFDFMLCFLCYVNEVEAKARDVAWVYTVRERLRFNVKLVSTKKSHPVWQSQQCQRTIQKLTSIDYYKAGNNFLSEKNVT